MLDKSEGVLRCTACLEVTEGAVEGVSGGGEGGGPVVYHVSPPFRGDLQRCAGTGLTSTDLLECCQPVVLLITAYFTA